MKGGGGRRAGNQAGEKHANHTHPHPHTAPPQVIADFVEPLVSHCQQLTSHRKFLDATPPEVEERVRSEKKANPAVHPYYLALREKVGESGEGRGRG